MGAAQVPRGTGGMGGTGEAQLVVPGTHEGHPAPVSTQSNRGVAPDHGGTVKGKAGWTK